MIQTMENAVLLVRIDRIGDLVLTLPCDQHVKNAFWFVSQETTPLLKMASPPRRGQGFNKKFSLSEFFRMVSCLRDLRPHAVIIFHAPWWVSLVMWLTRVPLRVGRRSQWHSFLFLNKTIRQKRHQSEKHELEYNLELCHLLHQQTVYPKKILNLKLLPPHHNVATWDLKPKKYFVVHPGMGGSAKNWPSKNYIELIRHLLQYQPVVITGTDQDQKYLDPIYKQLKTFEGITWLNGRLNLLELLVVHSEACAVVAPSTGTLHLAAALGTPTIGLYSSVVAESAQRWGPRGPHVIALQMDSVDVNTVLNTVLERQR
jgi:ADP-heptose:LPS heptosyltransferase